MAGAHEERLETHDLLYGGQSGATSDDCENPGEGVVSIAGPGIALGDAGPVRLGQCGGGCLAAFQGRVCPQRLAHFVQCDSAVSDHVRRE